MRRNGKKRLTKKVPDEMQKTVDRNRTPRSKTVRTNISVPRDLHERMKEIAHETNWSALACRAFEAELARRGKPSSGSERTCLASDPVLVGTAMVGLGVYRLGSMFDWGDAKVRKR